MFSHLPPPPPCPPKRGNEPAPQKASKQQSLRKGAPFPWSARMTNPVGGVWSEVGKDLPLETVKKVFPKARPVSQAASSSSTAIVPIHVPRWQASSFAFLGPTSENAGTSLEVESPGMQIFHLLDKMDTHSVDFPTMLLFLEVFGWAASEESTKYLEWETDWEAIQIYLGREADCGDALMFTSFQEFIENNDQRPRLFADFSTAQMLDIVKTSWLQKTLQRPGSYLLGPTAAEDFVSGEVHEWSLKPPLDHKSPASEMEQMEEWMATYFLNKDGFYRAFFEYATRGAALNAWYHNRRLKKEAIGIARNRLVWREQPAVVMESPQNRPPRHYEVLDVCWLVLQQKTYLHVNCWDMAAEFMQNANWSVQEPQRLPEATKDNITCSDGFDLVGVPDTMMLLEFQGMQSAVTAHTKKLRQQGKWIAVYLHHLVRFPRNGARSAPWTAFDDKVFELVDQVVHCQHSVIFEGDILVDIPHLRRSLEAARVSTALL